MEQVANEQEEKRKVDAQWEAFHTQAPATERQLRYIEKLGKRLGVSVKTANIKNKDQASRLITTLEQSVG